MLKTAVLIIGAGPTGLMAACQLAILKVPFIIVEKDPSSITESRAIGIQARSLEIFEQMGIAEKFIKEGLPATGINFIDNGKTTEHIPLSGIGEGLTKFPFLFILEQSKTEKILIDFLESRDKKILYDTNVSSITQDDKKTITIIENKAGKKETIQADWIIGADGAHSIVRHTFKIELAGKTYKQSLFVLDCKISSQVLSHKDLSVAVSDSAFAAFFPLSQNRWRIVGEVPPDFYGKNQITFDGVKKDFAKRMKMEITLSDCQWISLYHSHHRCVANFKVGRCFLVGDAAHIHSPVGAQGMNTGLQDAYNLTWKIAFVHFKNANESLLNTYNEERLPHAKKLVETTDRLFNIIIAGGPLATFFRTKLAPKIVKFMIDHKFSRGFLFKTVSQIGISYRNSPLSQNASFGEFDKKTPKPGDRLPFVMYGESNNKKNIQDLITVNKIHLFLFTQSEKDLQNIKQIAEKYKEIIKINIFILNSETKNLYKEFGILNGGYYLIRPDMYIAFRSLGQNYEQLKSYLASFILLN